MALKEASWVFNGFLMDFYGIVIGSDRKSLSPLSKELAHFLTQFFSPLQGCQPVICLKPCLLYPSQFSFSLLK